MMTAYLAQLSTISGVVSRAGSVSSKIIRNVGHLICRKTPIPMSSRSFVVFSAILAIFRIAKVTTIEKTRYMPSVIAIATKYCCTVFWKKESSKKSCIVMSIFVFGYFAG